MYIKEGIIKRFHNARKLIHAKLKEQLEFENACNEVEKIAGFRIQEIFNP